MQEFEVSTSVSSVISAAVEAEQWQPEPLAGSSEPPQPSAIASTHHASVTDAALEPTSTGQFDEAMLEDWISNLLRYSVLLVSAIILTGGILYLMRHGSEPVNYRVFQGEPDELRSPIGIVRAALAGRRRGIIQLGLLILIATPIVRVMVSLITFLRWRELTYVVITALVLMGLLCSFVGAYF